MLDNNINKSNTSRTITLTKYIYAEPSYKCKQYILDRHKPKRNLQANDINKRMHAGQPHKQKNK